MGLWVVLWLVASHEVTQQSNVAHSTIQINKLVDDMNLYQYVAEKVDVNKELKYDVDVDQPKIAKLGFDVTDIAHLANSTSALVTRLSKRLSQYTQTGSSTPVDQSAALEASSATTHNLLTLALMSEGLIGGIVTGVILIFLLVGFKILLKRSLKHSMADSTEGRNFVSYYLTKAAQETVETTRYVEPCTDNPEQDRFRHDRDLLLTVMKPKVETHMGELKWPDCDPVKSSTVTSLRSDSRAPDSWVLAMINVFDNFVNHVTAPLGDSSFEYYTLDRAFVSWALVYKRLSENDVGVAFTDSVSDDSAIVKFFLGLIKEPVARAMTTTPQLLVHCQRGASVGALFADSGLLAATEGLFKAEDVGGPGSSFYKTLSLVLALEAARRVAKTPDIDVSTGENKYVDVDVVNKLAMARVILSTATTDTDGELAPIRQECVDLVMAALETPPLPSNEFAFAPPSAGPDEECGGEIRRLLAQMPNSRSWLECAWALIWLPHRPVCKPGDYGPAIQSFLDRPLP